MADQVRTDNSPQTAYSSFKIMHSKTINVLLIGRSETGKTTIANTLINENPFLESATGYTETKNPSYYTRVLCKASNNIGYQLNILDTPGLQECNKDAIHNCFARWMKENITSINVICFVTMAHKTTEQDVKTFNTLKEFLGQNYSSNTMIVLTHCERISETKFEQYKTNLRESPNTKDMYEYCQVGVFSHGAVNKDDFEDLGEEVRDTIIEARQRKTVGMRDKLLETFIGFADKPVPVVELEPDNLSQAAHSNFSIMDAKMINVLLVGRSGTGKTTIINTLINENAFVQSTTGYSETKDPSYYSLVLCKESKPYQLNILDTPGLAEHNRDPTENRTDDELLDLAARCMEKNVLSLNVICFVTVAGKTVEQDLEIFKSLKEFLGPNYSSNAMIILTHCEQIPDDIIKQYIKDLSEHSNTKDVYEYCQLGVFSYGALNKDNLVDIDEKTKDNVTKSRRTRIAGMRDKLLETMIHCATIPVPVVQLENHHKQYVADFREKFKEQRERFLRENPKKNYCLSMT